jgi:hypothetical protein
MRRGPQERISGGALPVSSPQPVREIDPWHVGCCQTSRHSGSERPARQRQPAYPYSKNARVDASMLLQDDN